MKKYIQIVITSAIRKVNPEEAWKDLGVLREKQAVMKKEVAVGGRVASESSNNFFSKSMGKSKSLTPKGHMCSKKE